MLYVNRINVGDIVYFRVNFFGPNCESFIHVNFVSLLLCYSYVAPTFSLQWNKEVLDFKKKRKKKRKELALSTLCEHRASATVNKGANNARKTSHEHDNKGLNCQQ